VDLDQNLTKVPCRFYAGDHLWLSSKVLDSYSGVQACVNHLLVQFFWGLKKKSFTIIWSFGCCSWGTLVCESPGVYQGPDLFQVFMKPKSKTQRRAKHMSWGERKMWKTRKSLVVFLILYFCFLFPCFSLLAPLYFPLNNAFQRLYFDIHFSSLRSYIFHHWPNNKPQNIRTVELASESRINTSFRLFHFKNVSMKIQISH